LTPTLLSLGETELTSLKTNTDPHSGFKVCRKDKGKEGEGGREEQEKGRQRGGGKE